MLQPPFAGLSACNAEITSRSADRSVWNRSASCQRVGTLHASSSGQCRRVTELPLCPTGERPDRTTAEALQTPFAQTTAYDASSAHNLEVRRLQLQRWSRSTVLQDGCCKIGAGRQNPAEDLGGGSGVAGAARAGRPSASSTIHRMAEEVHTDVHVPR